MQLSYFSDYSLRVLLYTATNRERWCTSDEVSAAYGVSRHHIVKVVNALQHHGYLETARGRGGGFRPAHSPDAANIGEVVRRTESTLALVECFEPATNTCPLAPACGLKGVLHEAANAFLAALDRYSLADLIRKPQWNARILSIARRGVRLNR